jgi:DNA-binding FadR family transcriptional regulator
MFEKISRPSRIYQGVANQIEQAVLEGRLKPGEKLPSERVLAESFDVSRRTLREAFRVLEQRGLIEISKSGAVARMAVTDKLSEDLTLLLRYNKVPWKHLIEFRLEVESIVTKIAVKRATKKDIAYLESLIDEGKKLIKASELDWKRLVEIDLQIHLALARFAKNPLFEWILRILIDNLYRYYESFVKNPDNFARDSFKDMLKLVAAVKKRDEKSAISITRDHLRITSQKYFDSKHSPDVLLADSDSGLGEVRKAFMSLKIANE